MKLLRYTALATSLAISLALISCSADTDEASNNSTAPTLAMLQQSILTPSCAFAACHGEENPQNGLDLSSLEASAAALINIAGKEPGTTRVVPGDPDASLLLRVLKGPVGNVNQMPPGFQLSEAAIADVHAWIAAGAPIGNENNTVEDSHQSANNAASTPNADDLPKPEDLPAPDPAEGFQMAMDTVAPAGEEIWHCLVADLPTTMLSPVNRVESLQSRGMHHMDVMALGLLDLDIEPGMYNCGDLYYAYAEMMEEGIFLFASQNEREVLQLPEGVVAMVPPGLRVMLEIHYVNPTNEDIEVFTRVNAYTIPAGMVKDQIWGSAVRTVDIEIPPNTEQHYEWVRCEMNRDIDLIITSSHTHQWADYVDVYLWDGEKRGEMIYDNDDWHAPVLKQFDPPLKIKKGTGFEFRCHYRNPTDKPITWGFGAEDEMCQIGIVHTPMDLSAECVVTEVGRGPNLPD